MSARAWPERPASRTEQRVLPLPGTLAGRYAAWRATPEGIAVARQFEGAVMMALAQFPRPTRLSAKWIWESLRAKYREPINNSFVAFLARDLEDEMPCLRGLFRHRKQTAA